MQKKLDDYLRPITVMDSNEINGISNRAKPGAIAMTGWTPLFQQIIGSSVWNEPDHVRVAWITLLASARKDGVAPVTAGGLAILARISREKAEDALKVLSSPDKDTLTQEHEGRRIERVEDGWRMLNWEKYRQMAKRAILGEQNRLAQQRYRDRASDASNGQPGALAGSSSPGSGNRPESLEAAIAAGGMMGVPELDCRKFWDYYESSSQEGANGEVIWVMGKAGEKRVGQWQSLLKQWYENRRSNESHPTRQRAHIAVQEPPATDLKLPIVTLVPRPRKPKPPMPSPEPQPSQPSPQPS